MATQKYTGLPRDDATRAGASHPGGNLGANLKSFSHRCHLEEVAFVWELTKETINLPMGCLQDGERQHKGVLPPTVKP